MPAALALTNDAQEPEGEECYLSDNLIGKKISRRNQCTAELLQLPVTDGSDPWLSL